MIQYGIERCAAMLPPSDKLSICFAHAAYLTHERFSTLDTGISSFAVRDPPSETILVCWSWAGSCRNTLLRCPSCAPDQWFQHTPLRR